MTTTLTWPIICRYRDLDFRGNGLQELRRVCLPDGRTGWAEELAQGLNGFWTNRTGVQWGEFPLGTLVISLSSEVRRGVVGTATVAGGVLDGEHPIRWGRPLRYYKAKLQIKSPEGIWRDIAPLGNSGVDNGATVLYDDPIGPVGSLQNGE